MKSVVTLDENGYVVGYADFLAEGVTIPGSIEIDELPENFDRDYSHYRLKDGKLVKDETFVSEADRDRVRTMRNDECFSVVDRPLWLDSLSEEHLVEIKEWYRAWLDAPNTMVIPEKPSWLK